MKKRILELETTRYNKWPAWLMIILACLLVEVFFFGGTFLGGIVLGILILPFLIMDTGGLGGAMAILSSLHLELAIFILPALANFAWVK